MATIDWPTDRAFYPADFSVGADVPLAQWRAPNTGTREVYSRAADRMTCQISLPPCKRAEAARIESFLAGLLSTGDNVRFPMWHRRSPRGTLGGAPTVSGAVAAGVRTVTLAGALSRPNLLTSAGFEIDTNADGLSDGWTQHNSGSTGTITKSRVAGNGSTWAQRFDATGLGSTLTDQVGIRYTADANVTAGLSYALSADTRDNGLPVRVHIDWFNVSAAFLSSATAVFSSSGSVWTRRSVAGVAPAGAAVAKLYVWMEAKPGGPAAAAIEIDNVQFEQSAAATAYAGPAAASGGDFIAVGGNLLQVAYSGATLNDAGAGAVSLAYPVQKAIANGAAVTWDSPTGVWQLDTAGITFDYSPGVIMNGLVLPFRQVVV